MRSGRHPRLGVCLDSCHLYVSGVDVADPVVLDAVVRDVDELIGLDRLRALHVNDAAAPFSSKPRPHANVLEGELGERNRRLPRPLGLPGPSGRDGDPWPRRPRPDAAEMRKLRDLHAGGRPPGQVAAAPAASATPAARRRGRAQTKRT
jgi:deoxyribonuclease-4